MLIKDIYSMTSGLWNFKERSTQINEEFNSIINNTDNLSIYEIETRQRKLSSLISRQNQVINSAAVLYLILYAFWIIMLFTFPDIRRFIIYNLPYTISIHTGILWMSITPAVFLITIFYIRFDPMIERIAKEFRRGEEELKNKKLEDREERLKDHRSIFRRLTDRSAKAFFENQERYEQAALWRKSIGQKIDSDDITDCNEVQFLLNALNELILREENEQRQQRNWQYIALAIVLVFISSLVFATLSFDTTKKDVLIPVFAIPLPVIMWGAVGSLAAVLYRFYTEQRRVRFTVELRWLIARPLIGIIMGAVVYLALNTGLILFGANPPPAQTAHKEVYWIVSFLAGFSDKFYLGVINLLVERTIPIHNHSRDKDTVIEQKTRSTKAQTIQKISEMDANS